MKAATIVIVLGGVTVLGLVLYLALKPSQAVGLPATGGGAPTTASDPGWAFANSLSSSISSTIGSIVGAVSNNQRPT
jgi:hypothetical protein